MLHTKFCGNQSSGTGEEDFEGFLPFMGVTDAVVDILVM